MRPNIQTSALRGARICQNSHASFSPISLVALRSSFTAHTNTTSATASRYRLIAPTIASRRSFSSSPKQQSEKPQEPVTTSAEAASNDTSDGISGFYPPEANPPASTRPPPLDLPTKGPDTSQFTYLFSTGKAYLSFYKAGLKAIITNTKMVYGSAPPPPPPPQENKDGSSSSASTAPAVPLQLPEKGTRAELVLHHRWRHDIRRLPLFALMLLICGEFTPFVVLVFPSVVPYTCRIPSQVTKLRKNQERRRTISSLQHDPAELDAQERGGDPLADAAAVRHIARSLGVVSPAWDRLGFIPTFLASRRVEDRLRYLARDGQLLMECGGASALEPDEVALACEDRGIDVEGRSTEELRGVLDRWLRITNELAMDEEDVVRQQAILLTHFEAEWPELQE